MGHWNRSRSLYIHFESHGMLSQLRRQSMSNQFDIHMDYLKGGSGVGVEGGMPWTDP